MTIIHRTDRGNFGITAQNCDKVSPSRVPPEVRAKYPAEHYHVRLGFGVVEYMGPGMTKLRENGRGPIFKVVANA